MDFLMSGALIKNFEFGGSAAINDDTGKYC
jgi:hypothetical protein